MGYDMFHSHLWKTSFNERINALNNMTVIHYKYIISSISIGIQRCKKE